MSNPFGPKFTAQLPFNIQVLGRDVTLLRSFENKLTADVSQFGNAGAILTAFQRWESRRSIAATPGSAERENYQQMERRLMKQDTIRAFLRFLFSKPVFPRLFIFQAPKTFQDYPARAIAIDEACFTWDAVMNWKKKSPDKTHLSFPCAGYRNQLKDFEIEHVAKYPEGFPTCMCNSAVSEMSGCCSVHGKPGSKTLFSTYPFFAVEGMPEMAFPA